MVTETNTVTTEIPPPPRGKIIRNRDVDKRAARLAEDHVLPLPPGKELSWDQMQQYLALLTPGMWSHLVIYVYRLKPKIRRQLKNPNDPNYIDKLGEPFTMEYFVGRHGGGKYLLVAVNSEGKKGAESSQVFKCYLTVDEVQHAPILDYAELDLDARENQSYITWLRNQGILDAKGNPVVNQASNGAAGTDSAIKELTGLLKIALIDKPPKERDEIERTMIEWALKQKDREREESSPSQLAALITALKGFVVQPPPSAPQTDVLSIISALKSMQAPPPDVLAVLQQAKEIFTPRENPAEKDNFAQFEKFLGIADKLAAFRTGNSGRGAWDTAYDFAKDIGIPALQTLSTTITGIMALRRGVAVPPAPGGVPAGPVIPAAIDPYANPGAARQYAQSLGNQQPPAPPAPPPATPPPAAASGPTPGPVDQMAGLFAQYGGLIVNALNNQTPGHYFADNLVGLMGAATHSMIAAQGADALVATMLDVPEIAVFGESRIRRFTEEFIHYEQLLQTEEEPEAEESEPEEIEPSRIYRPGPRSGARA